MAILKIVAGTTAHTAADPPSAETARPGIARHRRTPAGGKDL
jgi:hypothetical protein